jgi:hypothetical protein
MTATHIRPAWTKATELFAIDVRSLAAFRIGVATVVLLDLWYRGLYTTAFFTDNGVLPRTARVELFELGDRFGFRHMWSLHMMSGTFWAQAALILLAALFASWMLIGYRTRLAAIGTWVLLVSLDARNPAILNSGDVLLRCMLLFGLFLPLGARWSIDQWKSPEKARVPVRVCSMATVALMLQLCMMYLFSIAFKAKEVDGIPSPWFHGSAAVYYALNCDAYTTAFGNWVRQFPQFMQWMTVGSLLLELIGPLLVFSPIFTKRLRVLVVIAFAVFHAGLGLTLALGLFPAICIVCWLPFLPGEVWDWLTGKWRTGKVSPLIGRVTEATRRLTSSALRGFTKPETPSFRRRWYVEVGLGLILTYILLWNVREIDVERLADRTLPLAFNGPARALGLDQNWSMFAPIPRTEDGWLVMRGTLHNDEVVNLWQVDEPLPWDKPKLVSAVYLTQRWRKYLDNITTDSYALHRMYLCNWLARRWNEQQSGGQLERQVHKVEVIQRLEITPPPGNPIPEPETRVLWTWYYES